MTKRTNPISVFRTILLVVTLTVTVTACDNTVDIQQSLDRARQYAEQGELATADIELRNILKVYPDNAEARYILGTISLRAGDLEGAEKEFQRALQAGWDAQQVKLGLARIYIAQQQYQALLQEIQPQPDWQAQARADSTALRALAEAGLGDTEKARATLQQSKQLSKDSPQQLRTLAMFQMSGIEPGDVDATLQHALALYPDDTELLLLAASHALQSQNFTQAEARYRKVIAQQPARMLTANGRRGRLGLARLLILQQRLDEAQKTLDTVLKTIKQDPEANFLSALIAFKQNRLDRAEEHIRVLLDLAPDHARSHQLMGKIKFAMQDYQQASLHLTRYLDTRPDDAASRKLLVRTYLLINRPELAQQTLQPLLEQQSEDADTRLLLSHVELALGDHQAGLRAIETAVHSDPANLILLQQQARAYIRAGDSRKALATVKQFEQRGGNPLTAAKLRIRAHLRAGDTDQALQQARALLTQAPDSAERLTLLGNIHAQRNEVVEARRYYQQALQQQQNFPAAVMGMAALASQAGDYDAARQHYLSLIERKQHNADTLVALAQLAAREGDDKAMLQWLQQARELDSGNLPSRLVLARYLLRKGDATRAGIHSREALQIAPGNSEALLLEGKRLIAIKQYDQAIDILKKLSESAPQSPTAQLSLAEAYLRGGLLEKARLQLDRALQKMPDNAMAIGLKADLELIRGNTDTSLQYARRLQQLRPDLAVGFLQEGKAWLRKQRADDAVQALDQAWQRSQSADILLQRYRAYRAAGHNLQAQQQLLDWLAQRPADQAIRFMLASDYQQQGNDSAAIEQYEILLEQRPDNAAALNNLAWLYAMRNNPKAIGLAERAYRLTPEDAGVLDTYGWILSREGNAEKGLRLIRQALQMLPDNPDILYHEALAMAKAGQSAQAREALQQLLGKHPRFSSRADAEQLLQRLQ